MLHGVSSDSSLSHPDLHVTYTQAQVKQRRLTKINNIGPPTTLGVHNGDIRTLRTALLERMYYCKVGNGYSAAPDVTEALIQERIGYFAAEVSRFHTQPSTMDEVVEMYTGRKKTIYANAAEEYRRRGLRREDAYINAFVKVEKVNPNKAPRCIQPRKPVYNIRVGRYIKKIEHRLYKRIARIYGDGPVVMKGYTTQEVARIMRGKWDSFASPVGLGLDATKFDMHVCENMLKWEHGIYSRIYGGVKELDKLLSWQRSNVGRGYCEDGKLKYRVRGKRASGDMNTALGNCLIMCALVHAYSKFKGIAVKLVNNGDDCMVFMEQEDAADFQVGLSSWFLDMGFRMTVEPLVSEFEKLEFCQMRPIRTVNGWTMVRNIAVALQKDGLCVMPLDDVSARKWMMAVGEGGLALCSGVPVMQSFYQAYIRHGIKSNIADSVWMDSGLRRMQGSQKSCASVVDDVARLSVFAAWGITPDEQLALEDHFSSWSFTGQDDSLGTHVTPHILNVL